MEQPKSKLTKSIRTALTAAGARITKAAGEEIYLIEFDYGSAAWEVFCMWNSDDANGPDPFVSCIVMPPAAFFGTVFAPAAALYGPIQVREGLIDVTRFFLGST
jgi:hypothetical protein